MENRLEVLSNSIVGTLRVATVYSVGLHELPPYLKAFMRRYASANVRLEYSRANRIYDDVSSGVVDLGIVAYPVRRSGLEILPFRQDTLVVITPPSHELARLEKIDVPQLSRQPFVAFERDVPTRRAVDRLLRAHGCAVEILMEFDNIETIKRAVEVESGISIVPLITVRAEVKAGTLVAIPFSKGGLHRSLGILVRKGRERPQIMEEFIRMLQSGDPEES
ncbi:MAG: LysR family transcriptional regulator substrate-binding protein [Candidatus Eisenbacteria bacterium]